MEPAPADTAPPGPRPRRRRHRRTVWIVGGIVGLMTTTIVVLALLFQFGAPWAMTAGDHNHVHVAEDGTRQHYQVHVPPGHDTATPLPVMMALHGCGMTGFGWNSMKSATQFNRLADREGFIVVYPTQRVFESAINCWNSSEPGNQVRGQGEPELLAGVAADVVEIYGADPDRIHVSGASSGAGAAVVLGITYPDVFATVTSVAGGEYGLNQVDPENPGSTPTTATARQAWAQMGERARTVPLLVVQGGQDEVVPTLVGERLVDQWTHLQDLLDDDLLNDSAGLTAETQSTGATRSNQAFETTTLRASDRSVVVEYVYVPLLPHAWPGADSEGTYTDRRGPEASAMAWRFAQLHDAAN